MNESLSNLIGLIFINPFISWTQLRELWHWFAYPYHERIVIYDIE